jgi:hypothetical protein
LTEYREAPKVRESQRLMQFLTDHALLFAVEEVGEAAHAHNVEGLHVA